MGRHRPGAAAMATQQIPLMKKRPEEKSPGRLCLCDLSTALCPLINSKAETVPICFIDKIQLLEDFYGFLIIFLEDDLPIN
jgi:hypothetical protein